MISISILNFLKLIVIRQLSLYYEVWAFARINCLGTAVKGLFMGHKKSKKSMNVEAKHKKGFDIFISEE